MPKTRYLLSVLLALLMILPAFAGFYPKLDGQIVNPTPLSQPSATATFSEPQVSSTVVNQITQFSLFWSDPAKMSGYIFSYNTGSGFVNDSFVSLANQTTAWTNTTMPLYVNIGDGVQWMYYMKDNAGYWWESYTYAFVAGQQPSSVSFANFRLITDNSYDLLAYDGVNLANLGNFPQFVGTYGSATGFEDVAWNPQATLAIAVGYNDSAVLFSRSGDSVSALYPGAPSDTNLVSIAWTPNGTSAVITGTNPDVILVYSSSSGNFTPVPNPTGITGLGPVAWNPVSNYAIIAGSNGLIRYSGTGSLNIVPSAAGISFTGIGFNPNGTIALLGTASGSLYEYTTATSNLSLITTIPAASQLRQIAFSRDGAYALMTAQSGPMTSLYKYDGKDVYQIASNSSANGVSFAPDDSYAMAVTSEGDLLTENYGSNATSLTTIANNTKLLGIDFLPPTVLTNIQNTSSTNSPLGQISIKATPGSYSAGTAISFSGRTLMSNGTIVPSQTIYIWINGRNQGPVTSNESGYWAFSLRPASNGTYYAAASQNDDGSGVTSQQLALTVASASTTSTTTTTTTTNQTTTSSSSLTNTSSTTTTHTTNSASSSTTTTNSITSTTSSTTSPSTTTTSTTFTSSSSSQTTNSTTSTSSQTSSTTTTTNSTKVTSSTPISTSSTSVSSSSLSSTNSNTTSTSSTSTTTGSASTLTSNATTTSSSYSPFTQQSTTNQPSIIALFTTIPYVTTSSPTALGTVIFAIELGLVIAAPLVIRKIVKDSKEKGGESHSWRW